MVKTPIRKQSFIFYYDYKDIFKELNNKQTKELIIAMIEYDENGIIPKLDKLTNIAFLSIKQRMDKDKQLYKDKCQINKKNSQKYWNSQKSKNTNEYEQHQTISSDTKRYQTISHNESEYDNDNDIDNDIEYESERKESNKEKKPIGFAPPTLTDIINFSKSIDFEDEEYCERFYNHYQSVGWVNGAGIKIQDWKLLFKNWVKKDQLREQEKAKPQKSKMDLVFEQFMEEEDD